MKILQRLFFSFLLAYLLCPLVYAEEEDWGSVMSKYKESEFDRIISNTEFNKAVKTREHYSKKSKKKEKQPEANIDNESYRYSENLGRSYPLLTLPADVYCENKVIKQGFYLVSLKHDGGKYFLELRQDKNRPVAAIEMQEKIDLDKTDIKEQASAETVGDDLIKINYSGNNIILESLLWKY